MFKYNPQTNLLEEQASMEKPDKHWSDFEKGTKGSMYWYSEWLEYDNHLSSLRKYPTRPGSNWDGDKEYEEGRDFRLDAIYGLADVATPISQEDDLWKELIELYEDRRPLGKLHLPETIVKLKQHFVITRKQ